MDIKDRRYRCCESLELGLVIKLTTWKTRTVPGSVEGIRYALEWAGLEYDYGMRK